MVNLIEAESKITPNLSPDEMTVGFRLPKAQS